MAHDTIQDATLVTQELNMAIARRCPQAGLLQRPSNHTSQGCPTGIPVLRALIFQQKEKEVGSFGLLLSGQYLVGTNMVARLDEHLEQTRLACEQGFAGVFYSEHFLTPILVRPHQMTFLARVAAEAGEMHVGTALTLLPLKNPVELADMAATLDHITHGRFILGLGLGYREIEYKAFGLTKAMAVTVFEERLAILKRLWSEDEITYQGHGFTLEKATCTLRPAQKPHPPIWIGANNEGAIRRAATCGDAWLINPHGRYGYAHRAYPYLP